MTNEQEDADGNVYDADNPSALATRRVRLTHWSDQIDLQEWRPLEGVRHSVGLCSEYGDVGIGTEEDNDDGSSDHHSIILSAQGARDLLAWLLAHETDFA